MAMVLNYSACLTVCKAAIVLCYSAAGLMTDASFEASMTAAAVACHEEQTVCMAACEEEFLAEVGAGTAAMGWFL